MGFFNRLREDIDAMRERDPAAMRESQRSENLSSHAGYDGMIEDLDD